MSEAKLLQALAEVGLALGDQVRSRDEADLVSGTVVSAELDAHGVLLVTFDDSLRGYAYSHTRPATSIAKV